MSSDEDYEFQYEEEPEEQNPILANEYYIAKGLIETNPQEALKGFEDMITYIPTEGYEHIGDGESELVLLIPELTKWGCKALKQLVKLYCELGDYENMMDFYKRMLGYMESAVTRNYIEKCINSIMYFVSRSAGQNFSFEEFYQITLNALVEFKNERLSFKANLKLCEIWFDNGEYGRMSKILKELHKSCQKEDGTDDQSKGTQLLEVYAIEIQMYTETKNNKKLKEVYDKALSLKSAIIHPKIMGIIRECGGKMHFAERKLTDAARDFFEAFKNYDEAGNDRRIQCLKYLALANMLIESEINPFDGQEARQYRNHPDILAMENLLVAYQQNKISEFEEILKVQTIMEDPFLQNSIEDLSRNIRIPALLKLIMPYSRIRIPFISKELNVPEKDVEDLLISLILDNQIDARIDQVNRVLEHGDRYTDQNG